MVVGNIKYRSNICKSCRLDIKYKSKDCNILRWAKLIILQNCPEDYILFYVTELYDYIITMINYYILLHFFLKILILWNIIIKSIIKNSLLLSGILNNEDIS